MGSGLGHWCTARSSCISRPFRKSFPGPCNDTYSYMKWHCCFPSLSAVPHTHLARKTRKDQHQPAKCYNSKSLYEDTICPPLHPVSTIHFRQYFASRIVRVSNMIPHVTKLALFLT